MSSDNEVILHASCVVWDQRAALIRGASGQGKSTLALQLLAYGAQLVADDRVRITADACGLIAAPAPHLAGLIEARGLGILRADHTPAARVACVVDLDRTERDRLPDQREACILGQTVALLWRVDGPHFAPALLQYLKSGRKTLS